MNIKVEKVNGVVLIRLNRPQALNALNKQLMKELVATLKEYDTQPEIGCFIITGSEKAFAAGADIKEMADKSYLDMLHEDYFSGWKALTAIRTPIIAAVSGYALGGGCELAMMCDIIYASDTAQFGQPEINLGVIPAIGGTQRLTKAIGKYKAMEMILTGRFITAEEAEKAGLVAQIFPKEQLIEETLKVATKIATQSKTAIWVAKEAVNRAQEVSLSEGILHERRAFHALFSTQHQKEGMHAFIEKRTADFSIPNQTATHISYTEH
ncbi:enoyl-CoA hydratase-related protein [Aquimarina sp. ERC-38]|uniref:enoyl-CoA hydratase-related protein n=1 Tax=Aquimarina sp. ERC-38 TaxID=2949996 RepID=UPI0022479D80|nr:enoyl-CoA hydratase-related protein [Aquimarina sp. ERC-38]UZO80899.1 enoyl-CoA hydratase-related protein [Aquimarina sp. ERC-38]